MKRLTYPSHTTGSRIAAKIRATANKLMQVERQRLLKVGLEMIRKGR